MCLIWGCTWMAIKIGLNDLTPFFSLGVRYLIAGICLALYLFLKDQDILMRKNQVKLVLLITLLNYMVPYSLIYWGEQYIYSNLTAVIFATLPLNIAVLSPFFLKEERLSFFDYLGIFLGFVGTIIIFAESLFMEAEFHLWGIVAVYVASISSSIIAIILKREKKDYHPLKINLWPILLTGIVITLFSFLVEDLENNTCSLEAISSILYLSLFGTVIAFAIYFWMIRQIKLILLSSVAYIIPIIAIMTGWIFLQEKLTSYQVIGSFFVLVGIFVSTRKQKTKCI